MESPLDWSSFSDDALKEEIEAMQLAHTSASEKPFDDGAAKLMQKIESAKAELDKRYAARS